MTQGELERKIEETEALLQESVGRLTRGCPPHLVGDAAREHMSHLMPHLKEALEALGHIEGRRRLTEKELARQRAFRLLLATTLLP